MPNRILRDWTDSEAVNALSLGAEVFFVRLIQKADDFGRYVANPKLLRPNLFPLRLDSVREADLDRWIAECVKASLVRLYQVDGKRYVVILKFDQRLKRKPDGSLMVRPKFPPPPGESAEWLPDYGIFPEVPGTAGKSLQEAEAKTEAKTEAGEGAREAPPPTPEKPATETRPRRKRPSPPEEEEWVLYALATWPEWDEDDCRGAWASYRRRGWEGTKDWRAAAKTCFHRWRRDSRGRVAAFRRPAPLVGAHPQRGTGEGPREVTADSPEWVRAIWKALGSADRPDVPDELAAAVVEWRARKRGDEEPDGWRAGLEAAWDEVRRQDAAGARR